MPLPSIGLDITEKQIQAARAAGAAWAEGETHGLPAKLVDAMDRVDPAVTGDKERAALAWEMLEGHRLMLAGEWKPRYEGFQGLDDSMPPTTLTVTETGVESVFAGYTHLTFADKPREASVYLDNEGSERLITNPAVEPTKE